MEIVDWNQVQIHHGPEGVAIVKEQIKFDIVALKHDIRLLEYELSRAPLDEN